jgi:hypothetical protein
MIARGARTHFAALAFALAACSGAKEEAEPPPIIGPTLTVTTSASAAKPASKSRRPIIDPPDPEAQKLFRALLEQPAIPLSNEPPPKVTLLALGNTARGEARGMKLDGPPQTALLGEGQRASKKITIGPGACITYLAEGGLGVGEVDLFVSSGEGTDLKVLVEDSGGGPIGVIGGHDGCWRNPNKAPIEADLHVVVRRGQGTVVVQGFVQ